MALYPFLNLLVHPVSQNQELYFEFVTLQKIFKKLFVCKPSLIRHVRDGLNDVITAICKIRSDQ